MSFSCFRIFVLSLLVFSISYHATTFPHGDRTMAGLRRISFCVITVCLLTDSSAEAFGGGLGWRSAPRTACYYYCAPVTPYAYCPPITMPLPRVTPVPDARPTAAPPSQTAEPPLQKQTSNDPRMPVIGSSPTIGSKAPPAKDRCRVGFWNLSGRDVTLVIDGTARTLAKDRSVTLDLERQFTWQVAGQPQHVERVREAQTTLELVIRN
jgi:hypothetical protein